jgi:hypothetical protein
MLGCWSLTFPKVGTHTVMISELNGWPGFSPVERFARLLAETGACLGAELVSN